MEKIFGWIAIGNENTGSTRIGVINVHNTLLEEGYKSHLLNLNKVFAIDIETPLHDLKSKIMQNKINTLIFQKVYGPKALTLIKWCKRRKIETIYYCGDWHEHVVWSKTDKVVVCSPHTVDYLKTKSIDSAYMDDGLETTDWKRPKSYKDTNHLTLGWYGNLMKLNYAETFYEKIKNKLPFSSSLYTISNTIKGFPQQADLIMGEGTGKPWDVDKLLEILTDKIDVIIVPIDLSKDKNKIYSKTANRVTLPMSIGVPVIATPIPTYELVIKNKVNGYLCESEKEWTDALTDLFPCKKRQEIGQHSMSEIHEKYSLKSLIKRWVSFDN